jgi:hypothetical protein
VTFPAPELESPLANAELQGLQTFRWSWTHEPLPGDHYFDLRIWSQEEADADLEPQGATDLTQDTFASLDLNSVPTIQQHGGNTTYFWAVVVVHQLDTKTEIVGAWSDERPFVWKP